MKNLAIAVLLLFAASLFGRALASRCMPALETAQAGIQMQMPSCCDVKAACEGGSCFASVHAPGCTADAGTFAVAAKAVSVNVAAPVPTQVLIPAPTKIIPDDYIRPPNLRKSGHPLIAGYGDIYARTGRLLI